MLDAPARPLALLRIPSRLMTRTSPVVQSLLARSERRLAKRKIRSARHLSTVLCRGCVGRRTTSRFVTSDANRYRCSVAEPPQDVAPRPVVPTWSSGREYDDDRSTSSGQHATCRASPLHETHSHACVWLRVAARPSPSPGDDAERSSSGLVRGEGYRQPGAVADRHWPSPRPRFPGLRRRLTLSAERQHCATSP